jgi:hypothetical protein
MLAPVSGAGGRCTCDVCSCRLFESSSLMWDRSRGAFLVRSLSSYVRAFSELSRLRVIYDEDISLYQYFIIE